MSDFDIHAFVWLDMKVRGYSLDLKRERCSAERARLESELRQLRQARNCHEKRILAEALVPASVAALGEVAKQQWLVAMRESRRDERQKPLMAFGATVEQACAALAQSLDASKPNAPPNHFDEAPKP